MDEKTIRALNAINRSFYRDAAAEFSATRRDPWPGWGRLPPLIEEHLRGRDLRVLDVGCGNGRFAAFLAGALPGACASLRYCGIDASAPLLEAVRARPLPFAEVETRLADVVESPIEEVLAGRRFSLIAVFGVLHHVASEDRRRRLLRSLAGRLEPGGLLALAIWRFEASGRFHGRSRPWTKFNATAREAIDPAQLERGDRLLPWGEDGSRVRYCHFADEEETGRLVQAASLPIAATYTSDGREGNLNRYFVLRMREGA
jgi:tRNA (uracil-5-)-methyltransferase TRM9